jgi:hypothetical protein
MQRGEMPDQLQGQHQKSRWFSRKYLLIVTITVAAMIITTAWIMSSIGIIPTILASILSAILTVLSIVLTILSLVSLPHESEPSAPVPQPSSELTPQPLPTQGDTITSFLQPLTKKPQCAWIDNWGLGAKVSNVKLVYDNRKQYESTIPDDVQQTLGDWCRKNEKFYKDLQKASMGTQVRLEGAEWRHPPYKYFILLSPSKYLLYMAIHPHLGKIQLRWLREKHFGNALQGLKNHQFLELPSNFAVHIAVVSRDGYLLLRQRAGEEKTRLYPSAWEAGVGEFMHGPENMPGPEYASGSYHSQFPHFRKKYFFFGEKVPDMSSFLKMAVAEELGYRRARRKDFRLYGFAVEYETLAPKLLVVYNSDLTKDALKKSAREGAKDPAQDLRGIKLTPQGITEVYSNPVYNTKWGWGPTSKLVILLALRQDLIAKGMEDQISAIARLIDCFDPKKEGEKPVDPWKFHE